MRVIDVIMQYQYILIGLGIVLTFIPFLICAFKKKNTKDTEYVDIGLWPICSIAGISILLILTYCQTLI